MISLRHILIAVALIAAGITTDTARAAADYSSPYAFSTLAGVSSIGHQDGAGANARFYSPQDVAVDSAGNVFVTDEGNHTIRKISPAGIVTTFAGRAGEPGSADGTGEAARFDSPQGIAIDASDNLYVADTGNHTIRKITPAGVVTTFAGLARVTGNVDGATGNARFNRPRGIASDPSNILFVTDAGNSAVRKITPGGIVSTLAGNLLFPETEDLNAFVPLTYGAVAADAAGNVYVSAYLFSQTETDDTDFWRNSRTYYAGRLQRIAPDGTVGPLFDTMITRYFDGRVDHSGVSSLEWDPAGSLVMSLGWRIRRYNPVTRDAVTLAGDGTVGAADGPASAAKFSSTFSVALGRDGTIHIADSGNNVVRRLSNGTVSTVAGLALESATNNIDGSGAAARFAAPAGAAIDASGNLYVADPVAHCIRQITPAGVVTTFAGSPGSWGTDNGTGTNARFNRPTAVAIDQAGNLYVTDSGNHTIRKITPARETTTLAGAPTATGTYDGTGVNARFTFPSGITIDPLGNLYVSSANTIRKVTATGTVTTLAGLGNQSGYVDAQGSGARFVNPTHLAYLAGIIYVADGADYVAVSRIRTVTPEGNVSTAAGGPIGSADGAVALARLGSPLALASSGNDSLVIVDGGNHTVRRLANGAISTLAGLAGAPGNHDGAGRDARFYYPQGVAIDGSGAIYVTSGTTVRRGVAASGPTITSHPANQSVAAGGTATFHVVATGTPSPTYQWFLNGNAVAGATSASLTVPNARASDAGTYTVTVSNGIGSVTSNASALTVNAISTPSPAPSTGGGGGAPSLGAAALFAALLALRAQRCASLSPRPQSSGAVLPSASAEACQGIAPGTDA